MTTPQKAVVFFKRNTTAEILREMQPKEWCLEDKTGIPILRCPKCLGWPGLDGATVNDDGTVTTNVRCPGTEEKKCDFYAPVRLLAWREIVKI